VDPSDWYFPSTATGALLVAAAAIVGYRLATSPTRAAGGLAAGYRP